MNRPETHQDPEIDQLILVGKIRKAEELVKEGLFDQAARTLPSVGVFEVMRLRLLIENHVKDENELAYLREIPLTESDTYQHLLPLCSEEQQQEYARIDEACTENKELRAQLERCYSLIAYEYFSEAVAFATSLSESFPERAEVWNLIILAKSKIIPARDFEVPIAKRSSSLEKFSEFKNMIACPDAKYMAERPEYAERYLKTKNDIKHEKDQQVAREKTKQSLIFARITLVLGVVALAVLIPTVLYFDDIPGIVFGVIGSMLTVGSLICNIRVNVLDRAKTVQESTLSYVLILLLLAAYIAIIAVGMHMIQG